MRSGYLISIIIALFLLVSCTREAVLPENSYTPTVILPKEEFLKQLKMMVVDTKEPVFIGYHDEIYLNLGDLPEGGMNDHVDGKVLALYFSYNPNDDFYGVKYHKTGVYGGSYEKRTIMYYPKNHTLVRAREGGRIKFNETWSCMTFKDIIAWSEAEQVEADCYSYISN
jgi:hypothetical protein